MNKILVNNEENELILNSGKYEFYKDGTFSFDISNFEGEIFLVVFENVHVVLNILGKNTNLNIHVCVEKNGSLVFNHFMIEGSMHISTTLEGEMADFSLYYSVLSSKNSHNEIVVKHLAPQTKSFLKNHGFSLEHSNLIFDVSSFITKKAIQSVTNQDNQIIENENSLSQINPNLYIEQYDVEASHSAYVGEFKEQELFYLMSRGLSDHDAKFLLLKSFLIGSFRLEERVMQKYYDEIMNYFNKEV